MDVDCGLQSSKLLFMGYTHYRNKVQYEMRFTMENQNFKDANIPHWGGRVIALSAHFLRGFIQLRADKSCFCLTLNGQYVLQCCKLK